MNKDYCEIENKILLYKSKETIVKEHIELLKRIDEAITSIDILIEIIKQQPTDNALDDLWILDKLNGFKNILKGGSNE